MLAAVAVRAVPFALLLTASAAAQDDPLFRTLHLELPAQFMGPSIAAGDLDLDGRLDVVIEQQGKLQPLAGLGDGGFSFDAALAVPGLSGGNATADLTLADVDEDGVLDVLASGGPDLDLLLGHGDLTYTALLHSVPATGDTEQLVIADLDADGDPDFAAGNFEGVRITVHLNAGGSFPEAAEYGPIPRGRVVDAGDWDLDGDTDLVFGEYDADGLDLLFNDGAGGFSGLTPVLIAAPVGGVAAADLDEDGDQDLATVAGPVRLLAGNGQGGFAPAGTLPPSVATGALTLADADDDGHVDVLIGGVGVALYAGDGDLGFAAPAVLTVGVSTSSMVVADFDRDGEPDVACIDSWSDGVSIALGRDGQAFFPGVRTPGPAQAVELVDFDHDGRLDVVTGNGSGLVSGCRIGVGRGLPGGAFEPVADLAVDTTPVDVAGLWAGPLDDDGDPDIVLAPAGFFGGTLHLRLGDGALGFSGPMTVTAGNDLRGLDAADFDQDGHTDLVTCSNGLNQDFVLFGHGDGTFEPPLVINAWLAPNGVATGDWNADGLPDFAVVHSVSANALQIHLKSDGPGFLPNVAVPTNQVTIGITGGDVDLDGDLDLVCGSGFVLGGGVIFTNNGAGQFTPQPPLFVGHGPRDFEIGDLDNDGLPDLLGAQEYLFEDRGGVAFLAGSSHFTVIEEFVLPFNTLDVALGDLDLDGVVDAVAALSDSQSAHVLLSRRGPFDDLQHPLAGAHGFARQTAEGTMQDGEPFAFRLADAPPFSAAFHVVGLSELNAPFKGGVLVPTPNLLNGPLPVSGAGALELAGPWVPGLPSGLELYLQFWWADAGGPKGFAASRALRATMP